MKYTRGRKILTALLILIIIKAAVLYIFSGRLIVYSISKANKIDVSYKDLRVNGFKEFIFSDLKIIDKRKGVGVSSKYSRLKPQWKITHPKDLAIDFELHGVRFIKKETKEAYDTLSGLVDMPFAGRWTYKDITGRIMTAPKGIRIDSFYANSDDIRLTLTGDVYHNNNVEAEIVIHFSKGVTAKIPDMLSNVVLQEEKDEWKSLSVKLSGDYKAPSIQISSRLFRLNIGGDLD